MKNIESFGIKKLKEVAGKIDITKLNDKMVHEIAEMGFEKAIKHKEYGEFLILAGFVIETARKNKESLSEEELENAVFRFYVDICLESLVREGFIQRDRKWTYKNSEKCKYKITEKGEEQAIEIVKKILSQLWKREKPRYIG